MYSGDNDDRLVRVGGLAAQVSDPNDPAAQPGGPKANGHKAEWISLALPPTRRCFRSACFIRTSTASGFYKCRRTSNRSAVSRPAAACP